MPRKNKIFWDQYLVGGIVFCLLLILCVLRGFWLSEEKIPVSEPVAETEEILSFRHPLTGELLDKEIVKPRVFGVMIENSAEAWPLSGLEDAFLVFEAPVEAAIPRFLAFYDTNQAVEKIGPVRSARPYYLTWAQELDALYVHVGGSPEALRLIFNSSLFDLNQFWHDQFFWRSTERLSPHNVYTSSELLSQFFASQEESSKADYDLWFFKADDPTEEPNDSDLLLNKDSALYQVEWRYSLATNDYARWQHGAEMKSADGDLLYANNIAIVYTEISIIDSVGRRDIQTIGQGEALVLQDGKKIPAVWKKESADDRLRFFAEDGKEIKWNAGKTWIEVLSTLDFDL